MVLESLSLTPFIVACLVSAMFTGLMVVVGVKLGRDKSEGVQKFHTKPTSRLGGVGIFSGLFCGIWFLNAQHPKDTVLGLWLLFLSLPVFLGGLVEDLTHSVTPSMRLILACFSSASIYLVFQLGVTRTDIAWLDVILSFPGVALLLTMLVVAGFINSVNIIDGFHGLASGAVIVMLLGIAALAWPSNDALVVRMCIITALATFGFALWNWPFGKIFLGDGGAY
jgi:UDP-GlcNAc:undecaprenyl-phosphate GlcNAc-1-phosphate transferase